MPAVRQNRRSAPPARPARWRITIRMCPRGCHTRWLDSTPGSSRGNRLGVTVDDADRLAWRLAERAVQRARSAWGRLRRRRSVAEEWHALDRSAPGWELGALRLALRGGAYDLAADLAARLVDRPEARRLTAEAFYAVGERERAGALAEARPDVLALARRAEARPLELLLNPQLHLALFTAHRHDDPARALVALNRFLR